MFERLERYAGKLARAVLRGRDGGNTVLLLGAGEGNFSSLLDDMVMEKEDLGVISTGYGNRPSGREGEFAASSSSNVFVSCKSFVSNPSVNQG